MKKNKQIVGEHDDERSIAEEGQLPPTTDEHGHNAEQGHSRPKEKGDHQTREDPPRLAHELHTWRIWEKMSGTLTNDKGDLEQGGEGQAREEAHDDE